MHRHTIAATLVLIALVLLTSPNARAFDVQGDGSFDMAEPGALVNIFEDPGAPRVALRVSVESGEVVVEAMVPGSSEPIGLGTLTEGSGSVFEGEYAMVRVRSVDAGSRGSWENRMVTGGDVETRIGTGSLTLSGGPVRIYTGASPSKLILRLRDEAGSFQVRTSATGPDLDLTATGDGHCVVEEAGSLWIEGSGTVTYDLFHYDENPNILAHRNPSCIGVHRKGITSYQEAMQECRALNAATRGVSATIRYYVYFNTSNSTYEIHMEVNQEKFGKQYPGGHKQ